MVGCYGAIRNDMKIIFPLALILALVAASPVPVTSPTPAPITSFTFKDQQGAVVTCDIVTPNMVALGVVPPRAKWVCY